MKKHSIILFILATMLVGSATVYSQSASQSASSLPASSSAVKVDKDTLELKERVSKIVETRNKDQKAVSGFVMIKDNIISVKNSADTTKYTIKIDEGLTKIFQVIGATKKEIKTSDIKANMYLIVTGPIVDTSITANTIYADESFVVHSGKITEVNKTDFYLKVMSADKVEYTVDIESGTKQNMLNIKTLEIEKSGFSKIKEGDTVHFTAKVDASQGSSTRFAAHKLLIIPQEYFIK